MKNDRCSGCFFKWLIYCQVVKLKIPQWAIYHNLTTFNQTVLFGFIVDVCLCVCFHGEEFSINTHHQHNNKGCNISFGWMNHEIVVAQRMFHKIAFCIRLDQPRKYTIINPFLLIKAI